MSASLPFKIHTNADILQMTHCTSVNLPACRWSHASWWWSSCGPTSAWRWESWGTARPWTCLHAAASCWDEHKYSLLVQKTLRGEKPQTCADSRVECWLLVVHFGGAAAFAGLERSRAAGVVAREFAVRWGRQIGHFTQTQAPPPRWPDTMNTCRNSEAGKSWPGEDIKGGGSKEQCSEKVCVCVWSSLTSLAALGSPNWRTQTEGRLSSEAAQDVVNAHHFSVHQGAHGGQTVLICTSRAGKFWKEKKKHTKKFSMKWPTDLWLYPRMLSTAIYW